MSGDVKFVEVEMKSVPRVTSSLEQLPRGCRQQGQRLQRAQQAGEVKHPSRHRLHRSRCPSSTKRRWWLPTRTSARTTRSCFQRVRNKSSNDLPELCTQAGNTSREYSFEILISSPPFICSILLPSVLLRIKMNKMTTTTTTTTTTMMIEEAVKKIVSVDFAINWFKIRVPSL